MTYKTPEETALLVALLLKRSKQKRARISVATLNLLSGRDRIRSPFIARVQEALSYDAGIMIQELNGGGFGLILTETLAGAPPITPKEYLPQSSLPKVSKRTGSPVPVLSIPGRRKSAQQTAPGECIDFDAIRHELGQGGKSGVDDE